MGDILSNLELKEEQVALSEAKFLVKYEASKKLNDAVFREEKFWVKRAHSLWRANGDKCSKLFHRIVNGSVESGHISNLIIEGARATDKNMICDHILMFYNNLFAEQEGVRPKLSGLNFNSLLEDLALWMERDISEDEVIQAINS